MINRRLLHIIITFLSVSCTGTKAVAVHDAHDFPALIETHVEALEAVKPAVLEIFKLVECYDVWNIGDASQEYQLLPTDVPALILGLEKFNGTLKNIPPAFDPFLALGDGPIKTAAVSSHGAYEHLIKENIVSISALRVFLEKGDSGTQ